MRPWALRPWSNRQCRRIMRLHAHLELADTPIIDKATLVVLGNDDYLLGLLHDKESEAAIEDYVAWILEMSRSTRH